MPHGGMLPGLADPGTSFSPQTTKDAGASLRWSSHPPPDQGPPKTAPTKEWGRHADRVPIKLSLKEKQCHQEGDGERVMWKEEGWQFIQTIDHAMLRCKAF